MAQQRFSPRDESYLVCTGFEVYIFTGIVFLLFFTAAFIFSVMVHFEWLMWPGMFVAVVAAYITLKTLERREYKAKLREIEAEYAQREAVIS